MNMDSDYSKMSQDALIIKILELVCENKDKDVITAQLIKKDLFPELEVNEILHLIDEIKLRRIPQLIIIEGIKPYLKYALGLEVYIKELKKMTKKQKLHRIVEFLSAQYSPTKQSFDSGEIAKAFNPGLSIYEINSLCEILIAKGDVINATTNESDAKSMVAVLVTTKTHTAYQTNRYLNEEDELFSIPIHQDISYKNVIVGNISGPVTQEDNSMVTKTDAKGKPKWLKWLMWILGALVIIVGIIEAIKRIF